MKKIIPLLCFFAFSPFLAQESDKRLTPFLKDIGIIPKVANVLDFVNTSTTLKLNDYYPIFITLDVNSVKYNSSNNSNEIDANGQMHLKVSNKMVFLKSALKNLYCFQLDPYKYLIVRLDDKNENEKYLLNKEKKCDCEKLYLINIEKQSIPQSVFSYYLNNDIPLLYSTMSFDALEFLKIEFLDGK